MVKSWNKHPKLITRFHQDYPDDLQIIMHDGGPRLSDLKPELIWVRIVEEINKDHFKAQLLNAPLNFDQFSVSDYIQFVVPESGDYPISVSDKYIEERPFWIIQPCDKCGNSELFDPPSELIKQVFPTIDEPNQIESFTSFCAVCGGIQVVKRKETAIHSKEKKKKWWHLWKE